MHAHTRLGTRLLTLVTAGLVVACGGSSGIGLGDGTGPAAKRINAIAISPYALAGWKDLVAVWTQPYAAPAVLKVYRQDARNPDLLAELGTIQPAQGVRNVTANEQWIALFGASGVPGNNGWVLLVPAAGPYTLAGAASVAVPDQVDEAIGWAGRLLAASGTTLRLYDLASPGAPPKSSAVPAGPVTSLVGVAGGIFVFHQSGYGYIDVSTGIYVEGTGADAPALARVRDVALHDGKLYVGGPSRYAGYFQIGRLDPSAAPMLKVEVKADQLADHDSYDDDIVDFAHDGATGAYRVAAEQPKLQSNGGGRILGFSEQGGTLVQSGSLALDAMVCPPSYCPQGPPAMRRFHVHNGRGYLISAAAVDDSLYVYELP